MNTEDIKKEARKEIDRHGCSNCWSDGSPGGCTCEKEKRAALHYIDKYIDLTIKATREEDIEVVENYEEDWFLTGEINARDAIVEALRNL